VSLRVLMLALLLAAPSTASIEAVATAKSSSCTHWSSRTSPPATIRVFRMHRRGSSVPAHIDVVPFPTYVQRVMASGAWPGYKPMESLKVGAIAIKQYAWWYVLNHQRGYSLHGHCYDIRDGDQYYRGHARANSRIKAAVAATWGVSLRKSGRFFRTGWSGGGRGCGSLYDGWHLSENGVTACARHGWSWRRIVLRYLDPKLRIVSPS
jgi:peptidoglycan hydrolase-like amidase